MLMQRNPEREPAIPIRSLIGAGNRKNLLDLYLGFFLLLRFLTTIETFYFEPTGQVPFSETDNPTNDQSCDCNADYP